MTDLAVGTGAIAAASALTGSETIVCLQSGVAKEVTLDRLPFWNGTEYLLNQANPVIRWNTGGPALRGGANRLGFYNNGTTSERMSIASDGRINVGGARGVATGYDVPGSGNLRVIDATIGGYAFGTYSTQDYVAVQFVRDVSGPAQIGTISVGVSSVAYNTTSDYRLKTVDGPVSDPLDLFKQLRFYEGEFKADPGVKVLFQLAHEAEQVVPYAVRGEKDAIEEIGTAMLPNLDSDGRIIIGDQIKISDIPERDAPAGSTWTKTGERPVYQEMDYSKQIPLIGAALQALIAIVEAQGERIAELERAGA